VVAIFQQPPSLESKSRTRRWTLSADSRKTVGA